MQLYNKIDKKVLEEELEQSPIQRTTISFYKYHKIDHPGEFRDEILIIPPKTGQ